MDEVVVIESNVFSIDLISVSSFISSEREISGKENFRGRKCCKSQFIDSLSKSVKGREKIVKDNITIMTQSVRIYLTTVL